MDSSTAGMSYGDWRAAVDKQLSAVYCITIEDAGFDDEYLIKHWESAESALEFVEWYGNKYDLDPVTTVYLPRERSR
jgi:hypothetical protein